MGVHSKLEACEYFCEDDGSGDDDCVETIAVATVIMLMTMLVMMKALMLIVLNNVVHDKEAHCILLRLLKENTLNCSMIPNMI